VKGQYDPVRQLGCPLAVLVIRPGGRARFRELTRSSSALGGRMQRVRMVLVAAEAFQSGDREAGRIMRLKVIAWRFRFKACGIAPLVNLTRLGRLSVIDESAVIVQGATAGSGRDALVCPVAHPINSAGRGFNRFRRSSTHPTHQRPAVASQRDVQVFTDATPADRGSAMS
jgi:hypothetical protein